MYRSLLTFYSRYQTMILLGVTTLTMLLGFLWYLPAADHTASVQEHHEYAFRETKFSNILSVYANRSMTQFDGDGTIGVGGEYPVLLSLLIRATTQVADAVSVPAYMWLNFAILLPVALLVLLLIKRWPGSQPWMFAVSPVLFLFAFYNWDLIAIASALGGLLLLRESLNRPDENRKYNLVLEIAGFSLLALGCWFKLFPIVFFGAAFIDRVRRGLWRPAGMAIVLFVVLSLLANLPLLLTDFDGWSYFYRFNQHRTPEVTIWYWLIGGMDPAIMGTRSTTELVNTLSALVVVGGGLGIAFLGWRSPRRNIMLPMACLLLVWWLSFNKIYDPNFDIYLLVILAVVGAPRWLYAGFVVVSITWYIVAFEGLYYGIVLGRWDMASWHLSHTMLGALLMRLVLLLAITVWLGRVLLVDDEEFEEGRSHIETAPRVVTPPIQTSPMLRTTKH